jgi:hypothetical protein
MRKFIVLFGVFLTILTIYSYSQIDLNLTLSSWIPYQTIQKELINLGYFQRPLSAGIFAAITIILYSLYSAVLYFIHRKSFGENDFFILIGVTVVILFFSYSAFSHDIFNYMFDARIVTKYAASPYIHKALDYPDDTWIRFMNWTHRTYPYGPVWLILTIPLSFFGFSKFVFTLLLFKVLFSFCYLGSIWLIGKLLEITNPEKKLLGMAFFALNPLILIESLISPHNEIVMLFFLLVSIYFLVKKRIPLSILGGILSAGIKFSTIPQLILITVLAIRKKGQKMAQYAVWGSLLLLIPTILAESFYREPYSWYFIPLIGMGALLISRKKMNIILIGISFGTLLRYIPYLYTGRYGNDITRLQTELLFLPVILAILIIAISFTRQHYNCCRKK